MCLPEVPQPQRDHRQPHKQRSSPQQGGPCLTRCCCHAISQTERDGGGQQCRSHSKCCRSQASGQLARARDLLETLWA